MKLSEEHEAELKVQTQNMFNCGGASNVLECISTMQQAQIVILLKLNEILERDNAKSE